MLGVISFQTVILTITDKQNLFHPFEEQTDS